MAKSGIRRDSKHRVLRRGESIRWDGKYQFKYHVDGKAHFVYSWRLEPTDKLPAGKKPCLSLRELEKQIGYDLDSQMHIRFLTCSCNSFSAYPDPMKNILKGFSLISDKASMINSGFFSLICCPTKRNISS